MKKSHRSFSKFAACAAIVAGIVMASHVMAEEKIAFEVVKLERTIEHSIDGGKVDYKSDGFVDNFEVEGGLLHSYTIRVISERNTRDVNIDKTNNKLRISGKVYRSAGFGGGGKYKAEVVAMFIRPVKTINPDDLELLKHTIVSGDERAVKDTYQKIVNSIKSLNKKLRN